MAEIMRSGSTSNFINLVAASSVQNTSINLHQPIIQKEPVLDINNITNKPMLLEHFQLSCQPCSTSKSTLNNSTNNTSYPMSAISQIESCYELNSTSSYQVLVNPSINPLDIAIKMF
ncbi:14773_t:CDS:1 [Gigaspora margarita]|uniref:14773_t:CDS:1 n=1 Tax=Gigaspora margarita TaxID=4874 RepID=A0ABN7V2M8_GIGMA|nr:14773_t:CDS:1 [Gigaspora margarita]